MRIARVQFESFSTPIVALERDGALYDVLELERTGRGAGPDPSSQGAGDFTTRVVSLGLAGLDVLDERLRAGVRPRAARLAPEGVVWLPPCDPERAHWLHGRASDAHARARFRLESPRRLVGHQGVVTLPGEGELFVAAGLAVLLGEGIEDEPRPDERAILGATGLLEWFTRDVDEALATAQLGPVLVVPDEPGPLETLRAEMVVAGETRRVSVFPGASWLAERLAELAAHVPLRAGDVVSFVARDGAVSVAQGASVAARFEGIGRLEGRAFLADTRSPSPFVSRSK